MFTRANAYASFVLHHCQDVVNIVPSTTQADATTQHHAASDYRSARLHDLDMRQARV